MGETKNVSGFKESLAETLGLIGIVSAVIEIGIIVYLLINGM
ncbi:MAG: hypothetical protein AABX47_03210 [Nanoarchaeota archaeon]